MSKLRIYHVTADWNVDLFDVASVLESGSSPFKSHLQEIDASWIPKLRAQLEAAGLFGDVTPAETPDLTVAVAGTAGSSSAVDTSTPTGDVDTSEPIADPNASSSSDSSSDSDDDLEAGDGAEGSEDDAGAGTESSGTDGVVVPDRSDLAGRIASGAVEGEELPARKPKTDKPRGRGVETEDEDFKPIRNKSKKDKPARVALASLSPDAPVKGNLGRVRSAKPKTNADRNKPKRGGGGGGSNNNAGVANVRSSRDDDDATSYNPGDELSLAMEETIKDGGDEIIVRRTMPGAMSHSGGGSAARRRTARARDKAQWRDRSGGGRRGGRNSRNIKRPANSRPERVELKLPMTLNDVSAATGIKVQDLMSRLFRHNIMLTQNQTVTEEILTTISHEFLVDIEIKKGDDLEGQLLDIEKQSKKADSKALAPRQPVIAIMGHVDHGKTSLLDYIRTTKAPVAGSEAGGITQHIGAYVAQHDGRPMTFLDTPGHAAFTRMRSRGARVTDIVVLVVAADDGVKEQTKEALAHAKAAGVEIIVAMNKIDKVNADPDKCLLDLANNGLQPVEWGGTVEVIRTSAQTGQGVDDLLETILTTADLMELKANPTGAAFGYVLEGKKTQGRGVVATVLIKDGTLAKRDWVIAGETTGRVRMLFNDQGAPVKEAIPGQPVEILGLDEVPSPGDKIYVVDEADAKSIQDKRQRAREKEEMVSTGPRVDSNNIFSEIEEQRVKKVPIILRCDVQGSLEVLKAEIPTLSNKEVVLEVTQALLGQVTENDVFLAQSFLAQAQGGVVIAFNVGVDPKAKALAREQGVEIESYKVIYEVMDALTQRIEDSLEPEIREETLGKLVVRATFKASRIGLVAGCYVDSGVVRRNAMARLSRDDVFIWEGDIESVKRFKEDVPDVREGFECGIKLKGFNDVQVGDVIEVFEIQKIKRQLQRN